MSRMIISTFLSIILNAFSAPRTLGQGILVLSNVEEPLRSSVAVASDAMLSSTLLTGNNPGGYLLEAVQVSMEEPLQNPSGFSISLYELITENTNPVKITDLSGSDPVTSGIFTYTAPNIVLLPSTVYSIVLASATPTEIGSFLWNQSNNASYVSSSGWEIRYRTYQSSNGISWNLWSRSYPMQYAIYATPIPTVSISATEDEIKLTWEGFEGVTYKLQSRSSLTDSEWTDVGEPLIGDGSEIAIPVPVTSGESQSYYRVEVLPAAPASE